MRMHWRRMDTRYQVDLLRVHFEHRNLTVCEASRYFDPGEGSSEAFIEKMRRIFDAIIPHSRLAIESGREL